MNVCRININLMRTLKVNGFMVLLNYELKVSMGHLNCLLRINSMKLRHLNCMAVGKRSVSSKSNSRMIGYSFFLADLTNYVVSRSLVINGESLNTSRLAVTPHELF